MSSLIADALIEILGEDQALQLVETLPNCRLPGKKFKNRVLRKRFLAEHDGLDLKTWADKYGVSVQTLYTWLRSRNYSA